MNWLDDFFTKHSTSESDGQDAGRESISMEFLDVVKFELQKNLDIFVGLVIFVQGKSAC